VPPEDGRGWSGRHPVDRRDRGTRTVPKAAGKDGVGLWRSRGGVARRVDMFEPLADVEKKSSGKTMRVIGIVMAALALILLVVSFA
jgi:hypothetical protein